MDYSSYLLILKQYYFQEYNNHSNHKSKVEVEVFTNVALDLVTSPEKIGDIQLDIEVENVVPKEESRAPEIVVKPKVNESFLMFLKINCLILSYFSIV